MEKDFGQRRRGGGDPGITLGRVRKLMLLLFVLGALGTVIELFLIGHYEEFWQWLPTALVALSLGLLMWQVSSGHQWSVHCFRAVMILTIASGAIGLYQHYVANIEFELEMYPSLSGFALFWKAIQGKSPPSLAPAWMVELGLLGIVYTIRHPLLNDTGAD